MKSLVIKNNEDSLKGIKVCSTDARFFGLKSYT